MQLIDGQMVPGELKTPLPLRKMKKGLKFDKADVVVSLELGNGIEVATDSSVLGNVVRRSLRGNTFDHLKTLSGLTGKEGNLWDDAHTTLRSLSLSSGHSLGPEAVSNDHCGYSHLSLEAHAKGLRISGLHHVAQSASSRACLTNLVAVLATRSEVLDVTVRPHDTVLNAVGKGICQAKSTTTSNTPYANAGLNGTGQVVGVGDTGLDDLHCFFRNRDGSQVTRSTVSSPQTFPNNRKVIQYIAYVDGVDVPSGHGSHVAGTVAGSDLTGEHFSHRGHASGAKIAFFDMSNDGQSIYYPPPLSTWVFSPSVNAKGFIHSNSWGSILNSYSSNCADIDNYHYNTDKFLAIFAAGNDGSDGFYSIGDPGIAKNHIAVGASHNSASMGNIAYFSSLGPTFDNRFKPGELRHSINAYMR
jgi:hypothetical protein